MQLLTILPMLLPWLLGGCDTKLNMLTCARSRFFFFFFSTHAALFGANIKFTNLSDVLITIFVHVHNYAELPLSLTNVFIYLFIHFCRFLAQLETFPVCHLTHAPIKVAVQCFPLALSLSSAAHCDVKPLNIWCFRTLHI